jgi:prevent-host-death family protein
MSTVTYRTKNMFPISKAASSLAAIIKRSRAEHQPIIVTQKGYPTGVIVEVDLFNEAMAALNYCRAHGIVIDAEVIAEPVAA